MNETYGSLGVLEEDLGAIGNAELVLSGSSCTVDTANEREISKEGYDATGRHVPGSLGGVACARAKGCQDYNKNKDG